MAICRVQRSRFGLNAHHGGSRWCYIDLTTCSETPARDGCNFYIEAAHLGRGYAFQQAPTRVLVTSECSCRRTVIWATRKCPSKADCEATAAATSYDAYWTAALSSCPSSVRAPKIGPGPGRRRMSSDRSPNVSTMLWTAVCVTSCRAAVLASTGCAPFPAGKKPGTHSQQMTQGYGLASHACEDRHARAAGNKLR